MYSIWNEAMWSRWPRNYLWFPPFCFISTSLWVSRRLSRITTDLRSLGVTYLCCCPVLRNVIKWDAVGQVTQREWSEIAEMQKLNPLRGTKMESKYKNCSWTPGYFIGFVCSPGVYCLLSSQRSRSNMKRHWTLWSLYLPSTDDFCHSAGFQKKHSWPK